MFLQLATRIAALPVVYTIPCCQAVSPEPLPAPSSAPQGCYIFQPLHPDLNSKKKKSRVLASLLIQGETDFRSCARHLVLRWLFRQYLINSGFTKHQYPCVHITKLLLHRWCYFSPLPPRTFLEDKGTIRSFKKCVNADDWLMNAGFMHLI